MIMYQRILLHRKVYGNFPVALLRRLISRKACATRVLENTDNSKYSSLANGDSIAEKTDILVDITEFHKFDAKTGIQRVVRSVVNQLAARSFVKFRCRLVYANAVTGFVYFDGELKDAPVEPKSGDIFLGLDLSPQAIPRLLPQIAHWKSLGVRISFVIYDLLPVTNPEYFRSARLRHFNQWLKAVVATGDNFICISGSVERSLREWMEKRNVSATGDFSVSVIPMGAEFEGNFLKADSNTSIQRLVHLLRDKSWVLMVGTLEPRKAHRKILDAFEEIWAHGKGVSLVLVGKPGWSTQRLQHSIRIHSEFNQRLFWFDSVDDNELSVLYTHATGVLVPSFAEGFGLPIIEANKHRKPVLARDIPVFREVGGTAATYFSSDDAVPLASSIVSWLENLEPPPLIKLPTWKDTTEGILSVLGVKE